jgi:aspartokinase/homoserine dehydrogenase 1
MTYEPIDPDSLKADVKAEPYNKQALGEHQDPAALEESLQAPVHLSTTGRTDILRFNTSPRPSEFFSDHLQYKPLRRQVRSRATRPLKVMKFGGTSVGNAACIQKVAGIVQTAARDCDLVVVVSAMSGVTNLLLAAAGHSAKGNYESAQVIFDGLRKQHESAINVLLSASALRSAVLEKVDRLLQEGQRLCGSIASLAELSPAARDSIAGLGERLSAPFLAAVFEQSGVRSQAVEATALIVTDSCHGAAEPRMDLTREQCRENLRPLLEHNIVPVVTGYIGATAKGVLTTLGRGGSDYSATIVGAALQADEVIIWTDVDGILTTDPRLVRDARTIPDLSYKEASDLAYFGAKVLHPKTLRPLMQSHIPVWIRNTFSPEKPGTRINASGPERNGHVKAITAMCDVSLITVSGRCASKMPNAVRRMLCTAEGIPTEMLLIAQSSSQDGIGFIVGSHIAEHAERALCNEFANELVSEELQRITADSTVALFTVVGHSAESMPGVVDRTLKVLEREKVRVVALAQGLSPSALSFVIRKEDVKAALYAAHGEFQLGANGNGSTAPGSLGASKI